MTKGVEMETQKVNDWQFGEMEWNEGQKAYVTSLKWSNDKKVTLYLHCERDCFYCVLETNRIIFDYLRENEKELMEKAAGELFESFQADFEEYGNDYDLQEASDIINGMDLWFVELDCAGTSCLTYMSLIESYIKVEVSLIPTYDGVVRDCMP
jgi:hypothetical protein